jgi:hypothetical protein
LLCGKHVAVAESLGVAPCRVTVELFPKRRCFFTLAAATQSKRPKNRNKLTPTVVPTNGFAVVKFIRCIIGSSATQVIRQKYSVFLQVSAVVSVFIHEHAGSTDATDLMESSTFQGSFSKSFSLALKGVSKVTMIMIFSILVSCYFRHVFELWDTSQRRPKKNWYFGKFLC